jgi:hypothetical protein
MAPRGEQNSPRRTFCWMPADVAEGDGFGLVVVGRAVVGLGFGLWLVGWADGVGEEVGDGDGDGEAGVEGAAGDDGTTSLGELDSGLSPRKNEVVSAAPPQQSTSRPTTGRSSTTRRRRPSG